MITLPWPDLARSSAAAWIRTNGAVRLTSSARRQVASDCCSNGTAHPSSPLVPTKAAQLTMMSMPPNASRTRRGRSFTASPCSKSQSNISALTGQFFSEPRRSLLAGRCRHVDQRDRGAKLGQAACNRAADMTGPSGDDGDAPVERHHLAERTFGAHPKILWNSSEARCRSSSRPTSIQYSRSGNTTDGLPAAIVRSIRVGMSTASSASR